MSSHAEHPDKRDGSARPLDEIAQDALPIDDTKIPESDDADGADVDPTRSEPDGPVVKGGPRGGDDTPGTAGYTAAATGPAGTGATAGTPGTTGTGGVSGAGGTSGAEGDTGS